MIIGVYSIKDALVGYDRIFTAPSKSVATRVFGDACRDPGTVVSRNPGDFDLYEIGTLNTDDGVLTPSVVFVARAADMVERSVDRVEQG